MNRAFIPTIFEHEDFELRPLSSLMERWGASPFQEKAELGRYEDDEAYYIEAALPGISSEDISVHVRDGLIYIQGEKKDERSGKKVHQKIKEKFSYRVVLPYELDKTEEIEATSKDGVLTLRLPKKQSTKTTHVKVKNG